MKGSYTRCMYYTVRSFVRSFVAFVQWHCGRGGAPFDSSSWVSLSFPPWLGDTSIGLGLGFRGSGFDPCGFMLFPSNLRDAKFASWGGIQCLLDWSTCWCPFSSHWVLSKPPLERFVRIDGGRPQSGLRACGVRAMQQGCSFAVSILGVIFGLCLCASRYYCGHFFLWLSFVFCLRLIQVYVPTRWCRLNFFRINWVRNDGE